MRPAMLVTTRSHLAVDIDNERVQLLFRGTEMFLPITSGRHADRHLAPEIRASAKIAASSEGYVGKVESFHGATSALSLWARGLKCAGLPVSARAFSAIKMW